MTYEKFLNDLKNRLSPHYQGKLIIGKCEEQQEAGAGELPYFYIAEKRNGILRRKRKILKIDKSAFSLNITICDEKTNDVIRGSLSELLKMQQIKGARIENRFH